MSEVSNDKEYIINKYGHRVHKTDLPWFDNYEDTRMCLNPDIDKVIEIIKKIHESNGRCPSKKCFLETSPIYKTDSLVPDTRCPCPDFLCKGECECGLFVPQPISPSLAEKEKAKENEIN